jgi:hypothetical protein
MNVDISKMKNLIHYICVCCECFHLSKRRLNIILWCCDVESYRRLGNPITGETYIKQRGGPLPLHVDEALRLLREEGKLIERDAPYHHYMKKEFLSLKRPDISGFAPQEIEIVGKFISMMHNNCVMPELNEAFRGVLWQTAEIGDSLPYECTLIKEFFAPTPDAEIWTEEVRRDLEQILGIRSILEDAPISEDPEDAETCFIVRDMEEVRSAIYKDVKEGQWDTAEDKNWGDWLRKKDIKFD